MSETFVQVSCTKSRFFFSGHKVMLLMYFLRNPIFLHQHTVYQLLLQQTLRSRVIHIVLQLKVDTAHCVLKCHQLGYSVLKPNVSSSWQNIYSSRDWGSNLESRCWSHERDSLKTVSCLAVEK